MAVFRPQPQRVLLDVLAAALNAPVDGEVWVSGITHDSRQIQHGDLYVAVPGFTQHGIEFLEDAVAAGAVAVASDAHGVHVAQAFGLPTIELANVRHGMAALAAEIYGHPERDLVMLGVTGTNGKTTTASMIRHILREQGTAVGMIGTLGAWSGDEHLPGMRTTPESTDLFALLGYFREQNITHVVMEVSSHGLVLDRVAGITFDAAAFTNLSQDHLDFHENMDNYFAAKSMLFDHAHIAVINSDDEYGRKLISAIGHRIPVVTFGVGGSWSSEDVAADVSGVTTFTVHHNQADSIQIALPMFGHFNVSNALCAMAVVDAVGIDSAKSSQALTSFSGVPGRSEIVTPSGHGTAVVDYAHTPDAVEKILHELRAVNPGRIITVIGCGGDRDASKRHAMGIIASELSDVVIVTDDNPRSENPDDIRAEVERGAREASAEVINVADRRVAIRQALQMAEAGDIVAVLGKGHELGQEIAGVVYAFDDREVIRQESAYA